MIQTFCFQAPLDGADPDPLIATLTGKLEQLAHLHRALRGVDLRAADGILYMNLRCEGRDRWTLSRHAKLIVSAMIRRIKLDHTKVTLGSVINHSDGRSLTKDEGRPIENLQRGKRPKRAVDPWWNDPSPQT